MRAAARAADATQTSGRGIPVMKMVDKMSLCLDGKRAERRVDSSRGSDLGIEVEEGVETSLELVFDLLAGALDGVHGDVRLVSIGQLEGCVVDFCDLALGEQPHSVDQG